MKVVAPAAASQLKRRGRSQRMLWKQNGRLFFGSARSCSSAMGASMSPFTEAVSSQHGPDEEALAERMFAKFGHKSFCIARVEDTPVEVPSAELAR